MQPAMTSAARRIFPVIAILALAGIVVSSVSLHHHYGTSQTNYCDFGASFNCDIVNRSIYSTVLGIPDALIGILGYGLLLGLATLYRTKAETPLLLLIASTGGAGLCALSHIYREVRAGDVVHFVSFVADVDFSDYGALRHFWRRSPDAPGLTARGDPQSSPCRSSTGGDARAYIG